MNITVNDEAMSVEANTSVTDLLTIRNVTMPDMVTVHMNDKMVERDAMKSTILSDGDIVEFVFFMGGGAR